MSQNDQIEEILTKQLKWFQRNRTEEHMRLPVELSVIKRPRKYSPVSISHFSGANFQWVMTSLRLRPHPPPLPPGPPELAYTLSPPPSFDPSKDAKVEILSRTTFRHPSLIQHRSSSFKHDLGDERHMILSATRCVLLFGFVKMNQVLLTKTSNRILSVASKTRQIEVILLCSGSV